MKMLIRLLLLTLLHSTPVHGKANPQLMLANTWQGQDVSGWLMSEKLDGVRGKWDGKRLTSKSGRDWNAPECFIENFPPFAIEGEIWGGRDTFQDTQSITATDDENWCSLKFGIFDVPGKKKFSERLQKAKDWFKEHPSEVAFIIEQTVVKDNNHLTDELNRIIKLKGEGLIVRQDVPYQAGRVQTILKVKLVDDAEAIVKKINLRDDGTLKSLTVVWEDKVFKLGTGYKKHERENITFKVGDMVTFKYRGFYKSGKPKFAAFYRPRNADPEFSDKGQKIYDLLVAHGYDFHSVKENDGAILICFHKKEDNVCKSYELSEYGKVVKLIKTYDLVEEFGFTHPVK